MTTVVNQVVARVTQRIIERSKETRALYLKLMHSHYGKKVHRSELGCTNIAHAIAAEEANNKFKLKQLDAPNLAILTAYNDMLSAHHPYYRYPELLKATAQKCGATAQVAGGVPAMCDGITQGQLGMELSLFSRDVIALSTAIALSHNVFDGVMCLGICDKIVPGLLIGSLRFGHLPTIFVPSGPMSKSKISNKEKAEIRKLYAEGKVDKTRLLESEMASYHSAGTCTFYGTANSNQMLMEIMGLQLPGSSFVAPDSLLRNKLTEFAVMQLTNISNNLSDNFTPLCEIVTEKSIVNAMIGLIATGGSTNHTLHLPAIAYSCGIIINWDDFAELSSVVPLLAKVYPNGSADVNDFHDAGGVPYVIQQLLGGGLLHQDVITVLGSGLDKFTVLPYLENDKLKWKKVDNCTNGLVVRELLIPFSPQGGLKLLQGNIGRSVTKISAIDPSHYQVTAPAKVFTSQEDVINAYHNGDLNCDCVVVLCFQDAKSNGMPELHGLTSALASLQDKGYKVALVTDGRMSGASGKVPNAIHLTPSSSDGGIITKIRDGDLITLDLESSILHLDVSEADLSLRDCISFNKNIYSENGLGRELFKMFKDNVTSSECGAHTFMGL